MLNNQNQLQRKQNNIGDIANDEEWYEDEKWYEEKGVAKKHKGFSKLPEAVQRKINKKLAKKV